MSIKKIEGYLNGFVNIHVEGYFIERFINMCRIQKIYLWNIAKKNDIYLTVNIGTEKKECPFFYINIRRESSFWQCF